MAEYICREEAINAIKSLESSMPAKDNYAKGYDAALGRVLIAVREVPPDTDVQSVKHGRWIKQEGFWNKNTVKCSLCGNYLDMNGVNGGRSDANFCPNCGARMDGEQND